MVKERMQVTNVPYRGAAPALADLVAGQVQAKLDNYTTVGAVRRRPQAERARRHQRQAPEAAARRADRWPSSVPGFEGYLWMGIVAPAGTPQPVVDKLAAAARRVVARPDIQARFDKDGVEPVGNGPDEFRALDRQRDRAMARARQGDRRSRSIEPQRRYFAKNARVRASASGAADGIVGQTMVLPSATVMVRSAALLSKL